MSKFILLLLSTMIGYTSLAQKNVIPSAQTNLLNLQLPSGSKQDKRLLSVSAAKILLEMETKKAGVRLLVTEVYTIPAAGKTFTEESLNQQLLGKNIQWTQLEADKKYRWAQANNKSYILYCSTEKNQTELYIAECNGSPDVTGGTTPPVYDPVQQNNTQTTVVQQNQTTNNTTGAIMVPAAADGYTFSTTNFDDGWTSSIAPAYVLVEKGDNSIYLLFAVPYNASQFSGTGVRDAEYYWDQYVTQYFTIQTKQFNDGGSIALKSPYMEGMAVDKRTGKSCFVGMYLNIVPNAVTIVMGTAPDEAAYRQLFPKANDPFGSDLSAKTRYNKFAIASSDLIGKWQNGKTETAQWYYTSPAGYEGYAGMTVAATSATFQFSGNGTYQSIQNGATGAVGNMQTFQQEFKGEYTVTDWSLTATKRYSGKTSRFDAYTIAVQGGRLLRLNNRTGEDYTLVRIRE
jgi:hypothetical protein